LVIAANMADKLATVDPANAARYQANLDAFRQRLDALDQRLTKRLSDTSPKPFFVFHEAYDYFEAAYGLAHAGVFAAGEPSRARVTSPRCVNAWSRPAPAAYFMSRRSVRVWPTV